MENLPRSKSILTTCSKVVKLDPFARDILRLQPVAWGCRSSLFIVLGERNECELLESIRKERVFTLTSSSYLHDWELLISSSWIQGGIHLCLDFCLFVDSYMVHDCCLRKIWTWGLGGWVYLVWLATLLWSTVSSWDLWGSRRLWYPRRLLISPLGQWCCLPRTLMAFVAPFLAFIALKYLTTLVDWQGIGLDSSRLIKRPWTLIWSIEMGSNIPLLWSIIIPCRSSDCTSPRLGLAT